MEGIRSLWNFLNHYQRISSQKINHENSVLIVSERMEEEEKQKIVQEFGLQIKGLPFKYLEVPVFQGHIKKSYFDGMIQKMEDYIDIWYHKHLNYGGRVVLINSVLNAVSIYKMHTMKFPNSVLEKINRICNKFFWGTTNQSKKIH